MSGHAAHSDQAPGGDSEAVPESTACKQATHPEIRMVEGRLATFIMRSQTMLRPLARIILLVVLLCAAALGYLAIGNDHQPGPSNAPADFSVTEDEDSHLSSSDENVPVGHSWALRRPPNNAEIPRHSRGAGGRTDDGLPDDRSIDTRLADDQRLHSHSLEDEDRLRVAVAPSPAAQSWPSEKWPRERGHADERTTATVTSSTTAGQPITPPATASPDSVGPEAGNVSPRPPAVARLNGTIQPPPNRR